MRMRYSTYYSGWDIGISLGLQHHEIPPNINVPHDIWFATSTDVVSYYKVHLTKLDDMRKLHTKLSALFALHTKNDYTICQWDKGGDYKTRAGNVGRRIHECLNRDDELDKAEDMLGRQVLGLVRYVCMVEKTLLCQILPQKWCN